MEKLHHSLPKLLWEKQSHSFSLKAGKTTAAFLLSSPDIQSLFPSFMQKKNRTAMFSTLYVRNWHVFC